MDIRDYQKKAWETAIYPNKGNNLSYPALGLGGESGEVLEKIKKISRDDNEEITERKREELKKEIGDVFWYLAAIATELNLDLKEVLEKNISKLSSRKERETLHGSGDNR